MMNQPKEDHLKVSLQKNLERIYNNSTKAKKNKKASEAHPWDARGLVDAGPMGFPMKKREEDLVQLGFPTCNPTRTSYT